MTLLGWLRKINEKMWRGDKHDCRRTTAQQVVTARLRLEQLEDRLTPTPVNTVTNVAVSITPNLFAGTATETVTATEYIQGAGRLPGVPIFFNVNGMTGTVRAGPSGSSGGQASFTITMPLFAVAMPQTVEASFLGIDGSYEPSTFLSPVYLNVLNAFFSSNVTFAGPPLSQSSLPINPYGSYNGESDNVNLFGIPVDFHYVDPGTIQSFTLFGLTLPGSFSAALFAPYENFYNSLNIQLL